MRKSCRPLFFLVSLLLPLWLYASATSPLLVHLNLDFTNTMDETITLEYVYFYQNAPHWESRQVFRNHNNDQNIALPRDATVDHIVLYLRPSGGGSAVCTLSGRSAYSIFSNINAVELIGVDDAYGNHSCQLVIIN